MSRFPLSFFPDLSPGALLQLLSKVIFRVNGWQVQGPAPDCTGMVIIAEPHTSNWDFIHLIMAAFALRLKISWLGKDTLFKPPLGYIMRGLGGIAIDRSKNSNVVAQLTRRFHTNHKTALVVAASGTRKKTRFWKSGFYRIAEHAGVPIVCGYLDYRTKIAGLGLSFIPTGDMAGDMDRIREFYRHITGKHPDQVSVPALAEESDRVISD